MITITSARGSLLDELAALEGHRPDLGGLVDEGARARLHRLNHASVSARAARRQVADRVRARSLSQDPAAADRVKRLGQRP
jgi:hypothetical protein